MANSVQVTTFGDAAVTLAEPFAQLACDAPHVACKIVFNTASDVATWAGNEREHWQQLTNIAGQGEQANMARTLNLISNESAAYEEIRSSAALVARNEGRAADCIAIINRVRDRVASHELLLSNTDLGKAVGDLRANPIRLMFALAFGQPGLGIRVDWARPSSIRIEDLLAAFQTRYPLSLHDIDPTDKLLADRQEHLAELQDVLQEKIDEADKLADRVRTQLTLEPSHEYWNSRARAHAIAAFVSGGFILTTIAALLVASFAGGFDWLLEKARMHFSNQNGGTDHWGYVVLFTLPAIAVFYALRPIMRTFIFSLQRSGDAGERATMLRTYLALTEQDNRRPTEAERLLILRQLFRPGPGDSQDDSGHDSLLEQLLKSNK